jgi:hypothetical protein
MAGTLDLGPLQSSPGLSIGPLEGPAGPLVLEISGAGKGPIVVTATALSNGAGVRAAASGTLDVGPLQSGRGLDLGPLQTAAPTGLTLAAAGKSPVAVDATPLFAGAQLSGGIAGFAISGRANSPQAVTATALSTGARLVGPPSPPSGGGPLGGYWWWWANSDMARRMIERGLDVSDD